MERSTNSNNAPDPDFYQWALTPPLGWNSWDCYGPTVTEAEVKANADYMAKNLKPAGWEYIIVDIRWYVDNTRANGYNQTDARYIMDEYGRFLPSPVRFPSATAGQGFKPLADYIHAKGLKFGIHIMRGVPVPAVEKNTPVLGSKCTAADIYRPDDQCIWLKDMYGIDTGKEGAREYYNSIFQLYAAWEIDFVKVDDLSSPYHAEEIELIRNAIDRTGRKIILSTSPGETPIKYAGHVKTHANMWRIVNDFWDNWPQLKEHFEVCNRWSPYIGNGHFPDADMLPLGRIGIRAERGDDRMSAFTREEQYTLMTLFAVFRSPLMFGGDLPSMDEFTLSLLLNREMLYVNQHSKNNRQLFRENDLIAWTADDSNSGDKFLAVFNAMDQVEINEAKAFWKSGIVSKLNKSTVIDIDLTIPVTGKLYLVVSDSADGNDWIHADWIEPEIAGPRGSLNLIDIKWKKATAGWGKATINKSVGGNILNIADKEYKHGIGTHAPSVIEFDIPAGYNQFTAKAGLDRESFEHITTATTQFMIFTENPFHNILPEIVQIPVKLKSLGLSTACSIKDIWKNQELGIFTDTFTPVIKQHSCGFYRISTQT